MKNEIVETSYGGLCDDFMRVLEQHIDTGIPVHELDTTDARKQRITMCMRVWERMQTDPNVNLRLLLKREFHRTPTQIINDVKVISFIMSKMNANDRVIDEFRVRKNADRIIAIGEATGDWKAIEAGTRILKDTGRVGEDIPDHEDRGARKLPVVFTADVNAINKEKKSLTKEEFAALAQRTGAERDPLLDYVQRDDGTYVSIEEMQRENRRLRALERHMTRKEKAEAKLAIQEDEES